MASVPNARVLVDEDGVINVYLSPKVMYDKEAFLKVQEGILGIYHPRCCSGLPIAYKQAEADT